MEIEKRYPLILPIHFLGFYLWALFWGALLFPAPLWSASCCGSSVAAPQLITNYDPEQISLTYSQSSSLYLVTPEAFWLEQSGIQLRSWKLDYSRLLSQETDSQVWQWGVSLPIESYESGGQSEQRIHQVKAQVALELLSQGLVEDWHPQILVFTGFSVPLGPWMYSDPGNDWWGLSRKQWGLELGALIRKSFQPHWDWLFLANARYFFPDQVLSQRGQVQQSDFWVTAISFGLGYSIKNWRLGWQGSYNYWASYRQHWMDNQTTNTTYPAQWMNSQVVLTYMLDSDISFSLAMGRDDWLGEPINTSLFESYSMMLQFR